jgi:Zn ribbon nucleic-acid-binding protein
MKPLILPTPTPKRKLTLTDLPVCCQDRDNVVQFWQRDDLRITVCKVCNHKYTRLYAESGSLGAIIHGT